jgi:hypothetical protein
MFMGALKELFLGNSEIFTGLFIKETLYDFTRYPVISLDLSAFDSESPGILKEEISFELKRIAISEELYIKGTSPGIILSWLIDALELKYRKKVVILIDEVDSPVTLRLSDPGVAKKNAKALEAFLAPLASKRDKIRFCFITGEMKHQDQFGEKGNSLFKDISLSLRYGGVCGITKEEFYRLFKDSLTEVLDVLRADGSVSQNSKAEDLKNEIVRWYGGYSFDGELMVIDPSSLMTFLETSAFDHYFPDMRLSPEFIKLVNKDLDYLFPDQTLTYGRAVLRTVKDVYFPSPSLLTQKGVFTLSGGKRDQGVLEHTLSFPNFDAERSFHLAALEDLTGVEIPRIKAFLRDFDASIKEAGPEAISQTLQAFLAKCRFEEKYAALSLRNAGLLGESPPSQGEPSPDGLGWELAPDGGGEGCGAGGGAKSPFRENKGQESQAFLPQAFLPQALLPQALLNIQKERAIEASQNALDQRIVKVLSLIISLSGFKLRNAEEDDLSVQGFLKHKGDKTVILTFSYLKGGFELTLGGRRRLLNEALSDAVEKINETKEAPNSLFPQEIKEIFLYLTAGSETLSSVFNRQGGFFWRPLSKAPGSSS